MTKLITREFLRANGACYTDAQIDALGPPEGLIPLQVAQLAIPAEDRVWVLTRKGALPDSMLWEWSARTVARALSKVAKPDPRSLAVIPILRRLASGEYVPLADLESASAAAWAAYSAEAWAAARAAAWAADSAAARAAERDRQIADIIAILEAQP